MQLSRQSKRLVLFLSNTPGCLSCQWRSFTSTHRRQAEKPESPIPEVPPIPSPLDEAPRSYGKIVENFTPTALNRPIGLLNPPKDGDNSGIDARTWKQKRDDFVNYDKHLERRRELTEKMATPYFREWSNMRHHKGKSFLAPPRLFKSDRALYFPNLQGQTLAKDKGLHDTTPVFSNKVSIVSVFSSAWAERQAASFAGPKENPELHQIVKDSGGIAQMIQINIEENALKAMLIKLFVPNLRRNLAPEDWGNYFVVRRGITTAIRDAIGFLNSKVGYTYLLDGSCRIRWAGSGICEGDETEGLNKGTKKLIDEARRSQGGKIAAQQSLKKVKI